MREYNYSMSTIYVIGHVNPDTDSIAAAIGYAWLLRERDGTDAVAARAGALNPQTTWVLERLELEAPYLLTDASPRFSAVTRRLNSVPPEMPLKEAWAIATRTDGVVPVVNEDGRPYGLITGLSLFNFLSRQVGPHPRQQEKKIAEIFDVPSHEVCNTGAPRFPANTRIRDVLNRILREEFNDFLVVDEQGMYVGVCRQRDVLNPPRLRIVLVDHNEARQAVSALDEAELLEILDHHRLGNPSTHTPIRFNVDVVGSTSTLVSEKIEEAGLMAPPGIAGVLLAGLLSDTLILSSPTTTDRDRQAAERLARWAFVRNAPLHGESIRTFGEALLRAGAGLSRRDPEQIVGSDMKVYEAGGQRFSVSQVEVTDLLQLDEHLAALQSALQHLRESQGLDFAMLMVTDVVRGSSRLLLENSPSVLDDLPYPLQSDGTRLAEGIVSRKKQLLPTVLSMLEA
ncbi:MAG: putative manganese-dependent inorganic diphosphatase [Anaerolineales bacterium]